MRQDAGEQPREQPRSHPTFRRTPAVTAPKMKSAPTAMVANTSVAMTLPVKYAIGGSGVARINTVVFWPRSFATVMPKEKSATLMTAYAPNEASVYAPALMPSMVMCAYGRPNSAKNMMGNKMTGIVNAGTRMRRKNSVLA